MYSEYFNLERQAVDTLRGAVKPFELQILSLITFGCPTAYYIYRNDSPAVSFALRVVQWNKYFDLEITQYPMERLRYVGKTLTPTILQKAIDSPDQEPIEKLLLKFRALNIPMSAESAWGLDGTTTEVTFSPQSSQTEARYSWWGDAPKEWKSLEHLTQETILLFREQSQRKGWFYI